MSRLKLIRRVTLILASALILSSCGSTPVKPPTILLPASPIYPKIWANELGCLSGDAYKRLVIRKTMCETRVKTLENAIKSYNDMINKTYGPGE